MQVERCAICGAYNQTLKFLDIDVCDVCDLCVCECCRDRHAETHAVAIISSDDDDLVDGEDELDGDHWEEADYV